jgi:hypothetical protein
MDSTKKHVKVKKLFDNCYHPVKKIFPAGIISVGINAGHVSVRQRNGAVGKQRLQSSGSVDNEKMQSLFPTPHYCPPLFEKYRNYRMITRRCFHVCPVFR